MKHVLLAILIATSMSANAQITTTKVAQKVEIRNTKPYDSLKNFLGTDVYQYIGQELYVKGLSKDLRSIGYRGFLTDYLNGDQYLYTAYESLAEKYFIVLDVIPEPNADNDLIEKTMFLKLKDKANGTIIYYSYNTLLKNSFPFIVTGFFEKLKSLVVSKEFVINDKVLPNSTDIQTGKPLTPKTGQIWKCLDLTIEEKYYTLSLILQNEFGEKFDLDYETAIGEYRTGRVYTKSEINDYEARFGVENLRLIISGNVKIGMTKEMCILAMGNPIRINSTVTLGHKSEQWIYKNGNLYIDDDILTAFQ